MEWHMNDLSIDGQFRTPDELKQVLEPLLRLRNRNPQFRNSFFISNLLHERPAVSCQSLQQSIFINSNRDFRSLASSWLSSGPFWNDAPCPHQDNHFEYAGVDVTEQGLGEAARRQITGTDVTAFSVKSAPLGFEKTPLPVQHGFADLEIYGHHDIHNLWDEQGLVTAIEQSKPEAENWDEFIAEVTSRFSPFLIIPETAFTQLRSTPFCLNVVKRSYELLRVLSQLVEGRDDAGKRTPEAQKIYQMHFQGDKACFSDESESNKHDFKSALTFPDPDNAGVQIFCPMHGKIKTPQTRIHFEWPIPARKMLKVLYIGPKITKA